MTFIIGHGFTIRQRATHALTLEQFRQKITSFSPGLMFARRCRTHIYTVVIVEIMRTSWRPETSRILCPASSGNKS